MPPASGATDYWRVSAFYFLYFSFLGMMVPYWSLYLQSIGLSGTGIGLVLASSAAIRIVAPNFWAWIGDRSGRRLSLIRGCAVASLLCFSALLLRHDLAWILVVVALHTFFWNAILAQYEVIAIASLKDQFHRYGQVRLWGSVSFVLTVMGAGWLFDRIAVSNLPWLMCLTLLLIVVGSFRIRDEARTELAPSTGGVGVLLRERVFLAFLAASLLMQVSHGPFYTYFSLYLQQHGFTRTAIGLLWALGVVAEIGVFAVSWRLLRGFSLRRLMLASMLLAVLRWIITGFGVDSVLLLAIAQCLHAATYGSLHAASVELIRRHFGAVHQGQGQAMYNAVSYGLGGSLGALLSGYLWEYDPQLGFLLAAGVAALSALIIWSMVRGPLVEALERDAPGVDRYDITL